MAAQHSARPFVVQISSETPDPQSSSRSFRRIHLNAEILKASKHLTGEPILVTPWLEPEDPGSAPLAIGIAWPSMELPTDAISLSPLLSTSASLNSGDRVRLLPLKDRNAARYTGTSQVPQFALSIELLDRSAIRSERKSDDRKRRKLQIYAKELLVDLKFVFAGQTIQHLYEGEMLCFSVSKVSCSSGEEDSLSEGFSALGIDARRTVCIANWTTKVHIKSSRSDSITNGSEATASHDVGYTSVGGLDKQVAQIRDLIEIPMTRPDLFRHFGLKPPKGILLHGPPGTGKTHLARAIVAATKTSVIIVNGSELSGAYHGETEERLRNVFAEARSRSPCIVILDEVDALCPRREEGGGGEVEKRVVATLLTIMDGVGEKKDNDQGEEERVLIIATTNRPNAIDPALRRPGRFDREIEIGIPDADARHSILKVLLANTPHAIQDTDLRTISNSAHGYVGADLSAAIREAGTIAIKRYLSSAKDTRQPEPTLTIEELVTGLTLVQPSAMREVFLEVPAVRWSDIGGQAYVQQKLRECVEWPLMHPEVFARLGVKPPKGILLFGPPGCSKTLTARALATESGLNFIAVKGPELLNKYVGESERSVRDIFRKARAASPSIIFFDEIDALGTSRSGGSSKHEGVLTTLLNEMDGVQELVGVIIVAATNRPDVIDSALMRPGRLDRILYVGPPDYDGRLDILRIRMQGMAVGDDIDLGELARLTDGCSGAELAALCQEAALLTMKQDMDALSVPHSAFATAARNVRRQITPDVIAQFQQWRSLNGLTEV